MAAALDPLDRARGRLVPDLETDLDFMVDFHAVARAQGVDLVAGRNVVAIGDRRSRRHRLNGHVVIFLGFSDTDDVSFYRGRPSSGRRASQATRLNLYLFRL